VSAPARFLVGLVALLLVGALAAFVGGSRRTRLTWLGGGALAAALVLLAVGAALEGAAAGGALALGLGGAAAGLAAAGRSVGAGTFGAGAGALLVVGLATTGLFWADPAAEALPAHARRPFRQAVLDLDAATALAYDAAGLDQLASPPIYAGVPLASATFQAPRALPCALAWGAVGAWGALLAVVLRGRRGGASVTT
jgi:hypothetical protein